MRRTPLLDGSDLVPGLALKAELFQSTGSFKVRGVTNRLAALSADERRHGVAGASAGNHAIALAWGAAREGLACTVFSWSAASPFKLDRARSLGAQVDIEADDPARRVRPSRGAPRDDGRGARPPVRRPAGDRRPGHGRARDPRGRARRRRRRRPGRRRRARRGDRDRGRTARRARGRGRAGRLGGAPAGARGRGAGRRRAADDRERPRRAVHGPQRARRHVARPAWRS